MATFLQFLTDTQIQVSHIIEIRSFLRTGYTEDRRTTQRIISNLARIGSDFIQFPKDTVPSLRLSAKGRSHMYFFEGKRNSRYPDLSGRGFTIGVGHFIKPGEIFNDPISDAEIDHLFNNDVAIVENSLKVKLRSDVKLTQGQWDALVDAHFQAGVNGFPKLLVALNNNDFQTAYQELTLPGYPNRDTARKRLFLS